MTKRQRQKLETAISALEAIIHNYTDKCSLFRETNVVTHERLALYLNSWVLKPLKVCKDYQPQRRLPRDKALAKSHIEKE